MSGKSKIFEFATVAFQASQRCVPEHARFSGKKVKKPPTDDAEFIEDEYFRLADRMGADEASPNWQKRPSHAAHPETERQGRQRLWRELQWQSEQEAKAPHPKPPKKSAKHQHHKAKPDLTPKKAA